MTATAVRSSTPSPPRKAPWRPDAVWLLTLVVACAYLVPARFTYEPMGAAGRLDNLLGIGLMAWWLITRAVPALTVRDHQPMRWVILIFFVALLLSAIIGYSRGLSSIEINGLDRALLGWVSTLGIVLVALDGIRSLDRLETLLKRVVLLGSFISMVAVVQFFVGWDPTPWLHPPGLSVNRLLPTVENRSVVSRVYGTSLHPIEFGVMSSMLAALSIHFALHAKSRAESHWRWGLTALIAGASLLSVSRSAVVCMAIVFVGYVYVWRPRLILTAAAAGVVGLGAVRAVAPGLLGTIRALFEYLDEDPSISGRTGDYEEAFEIVRNNIWLGRGPGTFNVEEYILLDNQWLNLLITIGVIGTMTFAALLLTGVAQAHRMSRRAHTDEIRHLGQALMLLIWVYAISSFFFDSLGYPQLRTTTFLALGCIGALWIMQSNDTQPQMMQNHRQVLRSARSVMGRSGAPAGGQRIAIAPPPTESGGQPTE
jgi:hypothetical protein